MREFICKVNGKDVACCAWGNPNAKPIIALHGWLDNAASFYPLAQTQFYESINRQLIAIDLPGHGKSEHKAEYYPFVDWVDDVSVFITENGWDNVDMIGHSMGGMIAQLYAACFPEKVTSLCLIEAIGYISTNESNLVEQLRKGVLSRSSLKNKQLRNIETLEKAVESRQLVSDMTENATRLIVERGVRKQGAHYIWSSDPKLKTQSLIRMTPTQAEQAMSSINCKTHLTLGSKGFTWLKDNYSLFQSKFKSLEYLELTGGHHVHMEQSEELGKQLQTFLIE